MSDPKPNKSNNRATAEAERPSAALATAAAASPPTAAEAQPKASAMRLRNVVLKAADAIDRILAEMTVDQASRVLRWVHENHADRVNAANTTTPATNPNDAKKAD